MALVNHTETEFTLDFIYVQPQQPKAKVRSRIITSPKHMKRLVAAMQDNLAKFEAKYGVIEPATRASRCIDARGELRRPEGDLGRRMTDHVEDLQRAICAAVEAEDGGARFREDVWERRGRRRRADPGARGRPVFEKAGVNISSVWGELEEQFAEEAPGRGAAVLRHRLSASCSTRRNPLRAHRARQLPLHRARRRRRGSAAAPT